MILIFYDAYYAHQLDFDYHSLCFAKSIFRPRGHCDDSVPFSPQNSIAVILTCHDARYACQLISACDPVIS